MGVSGYNQPMFGLPSFSKLTVLVGILLIVWYGFRFVQRFNQSGMWDRLKKERTRSKSSSGSNPQHAESTVAQTDQCAKCGVYLAYYDTAKRDLKNCGRADCPYGS